MLTFTTTNPHAEALKLSALYLETMGQGLIESHKLSPDEIVSYYSQLPSVAGNYSLNELLDIGKRANALAASHTEQ